ncbi:hypothetical protein ACHAWF_006228 [Thalassiosira exigua]
MGNVCCGGEEESHKRGVAEHPSYFHGEDVAYDAHALDRERQILLHQKPKLTRLKRASIKSAPVDLGDGDEGTCPCSDVPSHPKSAEVESFLLRAMKDNFVFDSVDDEGRVRFAGAMQLQEFDEGEFVMRQGDDGDYFYVVEEGEVSFHVAVDEEQSVRVGTGSRGSTFGELALLYDSPRAASVMAETPLKLYKIDQRTFRVLLCSSRRQDRSNLISLVENSNIFKDLDNERVRRLVDAFTVVKSSPGDRIVNKGDKGTIFYIVKSGKVKIDNIGHGISKFDDQILCEGDCFGEWALITKAGIRAANVTAVEQSTLLAISKGVLEGIIGPLREAIIASACTRYLRSVPLFKYLEDHEVAQCVRLMKEESFEKGSQIPAAGKLYVIQEGRALMVVPEKKKESEANDNVNGGANGGLNASGKKLVKLEKGDYFGDPWLCGNTDENGDIPRSSVDSVVLEENMISVEADLKCITLNVSDMRGLVSQFPTLDAESTDPSVERGSRSRMSLIQIVHRDSSSYSDYFKEKTTPARGDAMDLSKLKKHRILGIGTFGKVWLVTPKSDATEEPTPYAMKMVSKRQLLQMKQVSATLREKNVMESLDHPFLVRLVASFQDEDFLYFVENLIQGGELFDYIYQEGEMRSENPAWKGSAYYQSFGADEEGSVKDLIGVGVRRAVFFSASVIDAFAYMHNRRIVYRDLKPENILFNEKGYCIVVDMGFSKVVLDKTYTMCG